MAAVKRIFLRISWTLKALRMVCSTWGSGLLGLRSRTGGNHLTGSARGLDLLLRLSAEGMGLHGELLGELTASEDLDRMATLGEAGRAQGLGGHLVVRLEALVEVGEVDRLRLGAELLERHRHLLVGTAQLAHPHVDRVLAALVGRLALVAGAGAGALVAATRGLAVAGAWTAPEPLPRPPRTRGGLQRVQSDLRLAQPPVTSTRWPPYGSCRAAAGCRRASPRCRFGRASASGVCRVVRRTRRWTSGPA